MQEGDTIIVIRESNGADVEATLILRDNIGITFLRESDGNVWFMPWHAVRAVKLVSETERLSQDPDEREAPF